MYTSFAAFTFTVSAWHLCSFIDAATVEPGDALAVAVGRRDDPADRDPLLSASSSRSHRSAAPSAARASRSRGRCSRTPRSSTRRSSSRSTRRSYFLVPFGIYVFGGLYRCVWDMYMQYRATTKRVERTRVGYLALGGFVATTLTLTDVLPRFGVAWPAVGNVLGILYLYFLSQTLFRNRLLDLNELVGKMAVLGTLVVLLSAVYGFLLYWIGKGSAPKGLYLLNALVAVVRDPDPVRAGAQLARERHQPLAAAAAHRAARPSRSGAPRAARRRRRPGHGRSAS